MFYNLLYSYHYQTTPGPEDYYSNRNETIVSQTQLVQVKSQVEEAMSPITYRLEVMVNETLTRLANDVDRCLEKVEDLKSNFTFRDCTSIKEDNPFAVSGLYNLNLPRVGRVDAQCHMDKAGKGWTVLMQRLDKAKPHISFDRGNHTYKECFLGLILTFSIVSAQ